MVMDMFSTVAVTWISNFFIPRHVETEFLGVLASVFRKNRRPTQKRDVLFGDFGARQVKTPSFATTLERDRISKDR